MKLHLSFFLVILPIFIFGQVAKNLVLLDHWSSDTLVSNSSKVRYNDCFGFVHLGKEYAVAGSTEGTHVFELSAENKLINKAFVEGKYNSSFVQHRDYAVYKNYLYAVCDEGNSSLQIIDFSYLPDSVHVVADLQNPFGKIHSIFIDTTNALLYACLVTPISNGNPLSLVPMRVFNILDPLNPVLVYEGPNDVNEVHDIYVRSNQAYLNCGYDGLRVYDFTNPSLPVWKSSISVYQDQGYNHQGWLSPDGQTYVFADETLGKKIKKCKVNTNGSLQIQQLFGTANFNNAIPHNIIISNELAYCAYYNEGLRIFDLRTSPPLEIAHYDTYPDETNFKMNGVWGVFNQWPSGRIIASDRQYGLFAFDLDESIFKVRSKEDWQVYPNPIQNGEELTIRTPNDRIASFSYDIYDVSGKKIQSEEVSFQSFATIKQQLSAGYYQIKFTYQDEDNKKVSQSKKFIVL
jgi:choice-of-anchor B domain-containing protein